ncbi:MAG: hypothetical protein B7X84_07265 [Alphaproteobacteria bacterium 17-39-52]|nr:MAG: hypothetical protein B7X84_07265 [Alphaproteobacteria bacterium 17-39-52]
MRKRRSKKEVARNGDHGIFLPPSRYSYFEKFKNKKEINHFLLSSKAFLGHFFKIKRQEESWHRTFVIFTSYRQERHSK